MSAKELLPLQKYLEKLQEAADEIATERNQRKFTVYHLHGGKFTCGRVGNKMNILILEEARVKVNEKYELKLEP